MPSTPVESLATLSCAGILAASGFHFLRVSKDLKGDVPFHFDVNGAPSMFLGPRWFFLYPVLVGYTAAQITTLRQAKMRAQGAIGARVAGATSLVVTLGAGVLLYAQIVAASIARDANKPAGTPGKVTGMAHVKLILAATVGAVAPCLWFQYQEVLAQKRRRRG